MPNDYRNRPPVDAPRPRFPDPIDRLEVAGLVAAIVAGAACLYVVAAIFFPA